MKSFHQFLLEMPKYYPGEVTYMNPDKFVPISYRNILDYSYLGDDEHNGYFITPDHTSGFVFSLATLEEKPDKVVPIMRLSLRPSNVKGYKQVHGLRIQEAYSKTNITSHWYDLYLKEFGGIVSDFEHLEGGKLLWKSFIKRSMDSLRHVVSIYDGVSGEIIKQVTPHTSEDEIWSLDSSKKNLVLVYELIN